jgi:hypothetical protein
MPKQTLVRRFAHMKAQIIDGSLVITIALDSKGAPSASGKTLVHASTRGNVTTDVVLNGKPLTIGLNAYCHKG